MTGTSTGVVHENRAMQQLVEENPWWVADLPTAMYVSNFAAVSLACACRGVMLTSALEQAHIPTSISTQILRDGVNYSSPLTEELLDRYSDLAETRTAAAEDATRSSRHALRSACGVDLNGLDADTVASIAKYIRET